MRLVCRYKGYQIYALKHLGRFVVAVYHEGYKDMYVRDRLKSAVYEAMRLIDALED